MSDEIRYIPITGGIIAPELHGGADSKAEELKKMILQSQDQLKIEGTIYYVSNKGNDKNNGLSPETSISSFTRLNTIDLHPGDGVLFERGSTFRLKFFYRAKKGVSYGAYGKGEKPQIYGSACNYACKSYWSQSEYKNIWVCKLDDIDPVYADAGIIVFNSGKEIGIKQRDIRAVSANGYFYFEMKNQSVYLYSDRGNPALFYQDIEIGRRTGIFKLQPNVVVDNLCFCYTGGHGISGSQTGKISNCVLKWIGGSAHGPNNRFGNAIEFYNGCHDVDVHRCWIYQIFDAGLTFQGDLETSEYRNIVFKENLIEYCSWSIEWWSGWEKPDIYSKKICDIGMIENIVLDSNIMRFDGFGWSGVTRSPCHIHGPWNVRTYKNFNNFKITNNILDCANGEMIRWDQAHPPVPPQEGLNIEGNSYYRFATKENRAFRIGLLGVTYASDQAGLDEQVRLVDKKPRTVKWILK